MNFHRFRRPLSLALLAGGLIAAATPSSAASILAYTTTNVPPSGFGNWSHDADTLNDGIIPTTQDDNLLLDLGLQPTLTFTLDAETFITDVSILSEFQRNRVPGNLLSVVVTIGATSAIVNTTNFGLACTEFLCSVNLALPAALSSLSTTSFTLSDFVSQGSFAGFTALGEVTVNGGTNGVIPEPASWAMLITGFGLTGAAMRRRRTAVAA